MYYQSDFKFPPRFEYRNSLSELRRGGRKLNTKHLEPEVIIRHESDDDEKIKETICRCLGKWFQNFSENTSIHGVRFIGQAQLHWSERLIWTLLVSIAIFCIIHISLQLSVKFSNSPLSTVVESTIYPVSDIPYPSVTICPHSRLHAERCIEAESKFLPNASQETLNIFRLLLAGLNHVEFGSFDEFNHEMYEHSPNAELSKLNLTEVYLYTMLVCEEIFIGKCWWRNKYVNCCEDFFYLQTSEYGICYSFNSAVNKVGFLKEANESIFYPYRTSNYGEWSGLRVEVSTRSDLSLGGEFSGIQLIINHPNQWPNSGNFILSGSTTSITIKPTFSYTTSDVRRLEPKQRQCLNDDESRSTMTLPGLKYLQMNCVSECRQQYLYKYCKCSVSLFYPIGSIRDCNFNDLKCLYKYNDLFNYEKPPASNPYFDDEADGMVCGCLPECHRVDYSKETTTNILQVTSDNMTLDLHYQSANLVKYRTDVTFGWLDLMVAFGGIAGLFLGCSILSGVEILYYSIIIIGTLIRRVKNNVEKFLKRNSKKFRARDFKNFSNKKNNKFRKKANAAIDNVRTVNIKVISLADIDKNKENVYNNKARY